MLGLGPSQAALRYCVFGAIVITLVFSDLEERILPDEFTLGGTLAGIVFAAFVPLNWGIMRMLLISVKSQRMVSVGESAFRAGFFPTRFCLVCTPFPQIPHPHVFV